ncbi:hypothetical protein AB4Z48_03035 [Cupriavidus sp. 2TAF22]|uniref:hypothetical protein n=1 Tax=unclassified Cupriavidus TaxID=2640874 RepID=UPI003F91EBC5
MPLTTKGICAQILGSLSTFRMHPLVQEDSDCKVVVNHLLRKYSEPAYRNSKKFCSTKIQQDPFQPSLYDHAVPVNVIMNWLLDIEEKSNLAVTPENIDGLAKVLKDNLFLVRITKEEDATLTDLDLRDRMPTGNWEPSRDASHLPRDRYTAAGIDIVECGSPTFRRPRKAKTGSTKKRGHQ